MPAVSKPKNKSPLVKAVKRATQKREPLWKGPEIDGVTQSMVNSFLTCRERFRIRYVEGLRPIEQFNKFLEYGNMWHLCEEELATGRDFKRAETVLKNYAQGLCQRFPMAVNEIDKWYNCCRVQFPIYVDYWSKHPDVEARTPLMQEYVFDVSYQLPSGRVVRLRGKFDSVDLIGKGKNAGVYLQENKTKGDIDEQQLQRQLSFDMQTMVYLVALSQHTYDNGPLSKSSDGVPIRGVRYNVIRRPLSGGKGSIKQGEGTQGSKCNLKACREQMEQGLPAVRGCEKCGGSGYFGGKPAETSEDYYNRLQKYFIDEPDYWFMRWKTEISQADVERFKIRFLNPILEQLCQWYEVVEYWTRENKVENIWTDSESNHWQHPFGAVNGINEYGHSDLDEYLLTGSTLGLERSEELFRELQ